ncbi:tryptophan RNA-binding attenuation protein [Fodinisporobacter ferrooxydans]|uniref:Tryptophan RNA-binding attenuation protein n=1 Tax=Fodinisporobacter ferrooxydans TaxID=2901836 RepID=A0ABY4CMM1_9BACL|nr:tryptophan RNA-binding attenuation protein [Alicyclobacillaceae bacterium MYW30-H2]
MTVIAADDLELPCWDCHGTGQLQENEQTIPCPKCSGKGYIPTALGQTILEFVKRHL